MKLYVKAHESKTQNLIINLDDKDFLSMDATLFEQGIGTRNKLSLPKSICIYIWLDMDIFILQRPKPKLIIENETEISFFNRQDYLNYKLNPVLKW